MFALKRIHFLYSAVLFLQFSNYCGAADDDVLLTETIGGLNGLGAAVEERIEEATEDFQSSTASYGQAASSTDLGSSYNLNTLDTDMTSYIQNEVPSQLNSYSDLTTNFVNDGLQYGVNGLKAKIDFEKYLLEKGLDAAKTGGNAAKAGFSKSIDVGSSVVDYGVKGLKKKMDFEKALLDQGMKSAQSAGNMAKSGFGKSFNAAGKLGSGFSSFGGNLFRTGSSTFGGLMSQGVSGAQEAAGSFGLGLSSGFGADDSVQLGGGTGGFSFGI